MTSLPMKFSDDDYEDLMAPFRAGQGIPVPSSNPADLRLARIEATLSGAQREISSIKQDIRDLRSEEKSNFRLLLGLMIAGWSGFVAAVAKIFKLF